MCWDASIFESLPCMSAKLKRMSYKIPGTKPFFYKARSTVGMPQTSFKIAADILSVICERGAEKCVSVITDGANNMRGAWTAIEKQYLHIFANGCTAHAFNFLVKNVCQL